MNTDGEGGSDHSNNPRSLAVDKKGNRELVSKDQKQGFCLLQLQHHSCWRNYVSTSKFLRDDKGKINCL